MSASGPARRLTLRAREADYLGGQLRLREGTYDHELAGKRSRRSDRGSTLRSAWVGHRYSTNRRPMLAAELLVTGSVIAILGALARIGVGDWPRREESHHPERPPGRDASLADGHCDPGTERRP